MFVLESMAGIFICVWWNQNKCTRERHLLNVIIPTTCLMHFPLMNSVCGDIIPKLQKIFDQCLDILFNRNADNYKFSIIISFQCTNANDQGRTISFYITLVQITHYVPWTKNTISNNFQKQEIINCSMHKKQPFSSITKRRRFISLGRFFYICQHYWFISILSFFILNPQGKKTYSL